MVNIFKLNEKVAVITGGSGVLGSAMARALGSQGVKVALLNRNLEAAEALAREIEVSGGKALAVSCDVVDKSSVEAAVARIGSVFGVADILVNCAGGNKKDATTSDELPFFDLPADALRSVLELNFLGTVLPTQAFARGMAKKGEGSIINISSMAALKPLTKIPAYSAAKAATSNFTQWLAVHLAQNYSPSLRVNAISPGFFLTEQNRFLLTEEQTGELTPRGQTIVEHTPMARFGSPEDLAGAVLWLASDASRFVTGTVIPVDGGFSAFGGV